MMRQIIVLHTNCVQGKTFAAVPQDPKNLTDVAPAHHFSVGQEVLHAGVEDRVPLPALARCCVGHQT
ncbi:hypothetical protein [Bradyrhizobium manausense]|uniref:Uncharacterized protein n=1 Tax=Bradyrhizobium manausense TaxID=989370 RepID=A0A0R3DIV8_9BRAD|nr:hypothetical protein [Bradyrhizobium manausense]KRQ08285.1 hypothetical protein AOQ71_22610 [Bradyrhizobium manausense]